MAAPASALDSLDRAIARITRWAAWLALPLAALLFLQWPLRDLLHAWSREANDLAQLCFGVYVAIAVTAATRAGIHLTPAFGHGAPRRGARIAALLVALPWSAFLLYAAWPATLQSLRQLEGFAETFNPGYFILRLALCLLALLVLLQALLALRSTKEHG